jgi:hypothetical protein
MTCTRVQTVLLHPYTRTDRITQSVQLYRWDDPFRTNVHPRRADAHSCTARISADVQLCGRAYARHTVVRSDSFAMHSSTYYLAGSRLTFEIMRFGSNTGRIFNHHLLKVHSNTKVPSSRWTTHGHDRNLNRPRGPPLKPFAAGLPEVVRVAHGFALASPADRTFKSPAWLSPETYC